MADPISQKIIVNMDVPMGIGRLCAQAAHASWLAVLNQADWDHSIDSHALRIETFGKPALRTWLESQFTKVVLRGWGDQMLLDLKAKAESLGLPTGLMEEDGHVTALAIGPAYTEGIDQVTGHLHLL